nr:MAG TPA_asm: putative transcriptional regulator [Caudoviricetes sp.]
MGLMRASNKQPSTIPTTGYIRRFRLPELLGVSMPTIDRWVKNGTLPRPIKLTENVTAFDAVEINNWLTERRGKVA